MGYADLFTLLLAIGALGGVLTTIPYSLAAISYRRRDNGLAFLLLVSGVGIWNLMFVAQLLSPEPIIGLFFLALSVVGAIQAGLGWLLFASTASSTSDILSRRDFYAAVSVFGGIDIVLAITAPVHTFFWQLPTTFLGPQGFPAVQPELGYWLHTILIVVLFGAGTGLFVSAWMRQPTSPYARAYTVAGTIMVVAVVGSNLLAPGGKGIAPIVAISLTTIGWLQASRGDPLNWLQPYI